MMTLDLPSIRKPLRNTLCLVALNVLVGLTQFLGGCWAVCEVENKHRAREVVERVRTVTFAVALCWKHSAKIAPDFTAIQYATIGRNLRSFARHSKY